MRLLKVHYCLRIDFTSTLQKQKKDSLKNTFAQDKSLLSYFHVDNFEWVTEDSDYDIHLDENSLFLEIKSKHLVAGVFPFDDDDVDQKILAVIIKVLASSPRATSLKVRRAQLHGLAYVDDLPVNYLKKLQVKLFGKENDKSESFAAEMTMNEVIDGNEFDVTGEIRGVTRNEDSETVEYITLDKTYQPLIEAPISLDELYGISLGVAAFDFMDDFFAKELPNE